MASTSDFTEIKQQIGPNSSLVTTFISFDTLVKTAGIRNGLPGLSKGNFLGSVNNFAPFAMSSAIYWRMESAVEDLIIGPKSVAGLNGSPSVYFYKELLENN